MRDVTPFLEISMFPDLLNNSNRLGIIKGEMIDFRCICFAKKWGNDTCFPVESI